MLRGPHLLTVGARCVFKLQAIVPLPLPARPPQLPKIFELVGLGYSAWFTYRYLLFKSSREELVEDIEALKKKIRWGRAARGALPGVLLGAGSAGRHRLDAALMWRVVRLGAGLEDALSHASAPPPCPAHLLPPSE